MQPSDNIVEEKLPANSFSKGPNAKLANGKVPKHPPVVPAALNHWRKGLWDGVFRGYALGRALFSALDVGSYTSRMLNVRLAALVNVSVLVGCLALGIALGCVLGVAYHYYYGSHLQQPKHAMSISQAILVQLVALLLLQLLQPILIQWGLLGGGFVACCLLLMALWMPHIV